MKIIYSVVLLVSFFLVAEVLNAQQLKENEIVVIKGEKFVLHQVRTGETVFSISKKYKVDSSLLTKYNPSVKKGLKIGEILKIPYKKDADLSTVQPVFKKGDPTRFEFHTIKSRKETPYFISKRYKITIEQLYAYNPKVKRFRKGTKLRIPVWEKEKEAINVEQPEPDDKKAQAGGNMLVHVVAKGETVYSIAKKYNISESELLFYNPDAKRLKAGTKINIPIESNKSVENKKPIETDQPDKIIESVKNNRFFEHIIESGETLWGTTRKYKVSEQELIRLNPVLKTGFPAGVVIRIPVHDESKPEVKPVNEDAFTRHEVLSGETLYGLAARYDLTIPEIVQYNPVLENRNLLAGETILIPNIKKETVVEENQTAETTGTEIPETFFDVDYTVNVPESCSAVKNPAFLGRPFKVALFLPLFIESNDTLNREPLIIPEDTTLLAENPIDSALFDPRNRPEQFRGFYRGSENFIEFYEGVLLAIDSLQKSGMEIELSVFDTQQNRDSIRKFIYTDEFLNTDLILGPIFPSVQTEVAEIAAKNNIPMVSPLVSRSEIVNGNQKFYMVNPGSEYIIAKTAEMVVEEYFKSNFIIIKTRNYNGTEEGALVNQIREKLFNSGLLNEKNGASFTVYDYENEGPHGLRRILSKRRENVVIIPTKNEGELSIAISNVDNLADEFPITLIGTRFYQLRNKSIDVRHFHDLKMRYITPFWMDYENENTIGFIEKFKQNFKTEPGSYGAQGFDVTYYFLNALKYFGKDFDDCLPFFHLDLLQGTYHFEKVSQFGGYMNQGVSVIAYKRNYDVVRKRIKGQPRLVAEK